MNQKKKYDSTVARIAGNIAGHCLADWPADDKEQTMEIARFSVNLARAIVEEVERTEEKADD